MTSIDKQVNRETNVTIIDSKDIKRTLIAGLAPSKEGGMLVLRAKGCKNDFTVSIADLWKLVNAAPLGVCKDCLETMDEVIE
tara:strand:- start:344 stop:589 length:246 start_codon:yes stop_codon:yes gene_type:complete